MTTLLANHANIEEKVFYPAVVAEVDGQEGQVDQRLEEHHTAELLLIELDRMQSESDRFDPKVTVLKEMVVHHLQEQEELLPQIVDQLPEQRRRELGGAMLTAWSIAPILPHPYAPSTPPRNLSVAIPATVIDLTIGAARGVGRAKGR